MKSTKEIELSRIPSVYKPSLVLTHGRGDYVFDEKGKRYIDFTSGIAVNTFGHRWDIIGPSLQKQISQLIHCSNHFTTPSHIRAVNVLVDFVNKACKTDHFSSAFLCNSGTEANEAALKFSRIAMQKLTTNRKKTSFISFTNAFHGRTMGALSVTAREKYKTYFEPLIPDCTIIPYNDSAILRDTAGENTAAIILEPLQGEGGLGEIQKEFVNTIMEVAKEYSILIIADEIQSGLYRAGTALACSECELIPDIVTLAKSLAGGLPAGTCIISEKVNSLLSIGDHGSTMGGNPLCCEAILAVFKKLQSPVFHIERKNSAKHFLKKTTELTEYLKKKFPETNAKIMGKGHLLGIYLSETVATQKIIELARQKGLLILPTGENSLRLAPALTCSSEVIKRAFVILKNACKKVLTKKH